MTAPLGEYRWANNELRRYRYAMTTGFKLIGFDPRVPPPFDHSTAGAVNMLQTGGESPFVVALDEVTGFFDGQGNWVVAVKAAEQWDQVFAGATAYISSWVLCYEPPPPDLPKGGRPIDWKGLISSETLEKIGSRMGAAVAGGPGRGRHASAREPLRGTEKAKPGDGNCTETAAARAGDAGPERP